MHTICAYHLCDGGVMGVWHGQGCGLRAAFFFHVFFEILFYSVMQEHTGARDGGVARQGGGA